MIALFIGAALAVAALVFVLVPLFDVVGQGRSRLTGTRAKVAIVPETAIDALREIEFDRATGKLSDDDYSALKTEYTRTALVEMRSRAAPTAVAVPAGGPAPNADRPAVAADDVEAAVGAARDEGGGDAVPVGAQDVRDLWPSAGARPGLLFLLRHIPQGHVRPLWRRG